MVNAEGGGVLKRNNELAESDTDGMDKFGFPLRNLVYTTPGKISKIDLRCCVDPLKAVSALKRSGHPQILISL